MKKLILFLTLLFVPFLSAQDYTKNYNKYSVFGAAGISTPSDPHAQVAAGFSYKFAANYEKPIDTVYIGTSYTSAGSDVAVGVQRTMMNDRDRMGLVAVAETGLARLAHTGVVKPEAAVGLGLAFDLNGSPYPAYCKNVTAFFLPKLNKVAGLPMFWSLKLGFSKSF